MMHIYLQIDAWKNIKQCGESDKAYYLKWKLDISNKFEVDVKTWSFTFYLLVGSKVQLACDEHKNWIEF